MLTEQEQRGGLGVAAMAAAMVAVVLFAPQVLGDGDTWWHLATGQWILNHGRIPDRDVFSYIMAGRPWLAQEWLSQLLMALAFRFGGWSGVAILFALSVGLTVMLLGRHLGRWLQPLPLFVAIVLALSLLSPSLLARPHLLVLPVMEFWCASLVIARAENRPPPPGLLLLMVLWTNLHGSFPVGLCFAAALSLETLFTDRREAGPWFGFTVMAAVVTLINPNGLAGALFPIHLVNSGALGDIIEWQPARLRDLPPIVPVVLVLAYLVTVRGFRPRFWRLMILLVLVTEALLHIRNQMLVGIAGTLAIAPDLGRCFGVMRQRGRNERWQGALPFALAAALLCGIRVGHPLVRHDDAVTPATALAHVPPALRSAPVYNDAALGGYLIFVGVRPFIDGRAELYGAAFMARYQKAISGPGSLFADEIAQYHIRWAVVGVRSSAAPLLAALPGWSCAYRDATAALFIRN